MNDIERAAELEKRILGAVSSGFILTHLYLVHKYGHCEGCAIAAAAHVLSGTKEAITREACVEAVTGHVSDLRLTLYEAAQLELGYEDGLRIHEYYADATDSFYQLGYRLRSIRKECRY